jgi:hypothetical protein
VADILKEDSGFLKGPPMPYIKSDLRDALDDTINRLAQDIDALCHVDPGLPEFGRDKAKAVGILNYTISKLLHLTFIRLSNFDYASELKEGGKLLPLSYADYNSIIGVLECAKLEIYRRTAAPYEDEKIEQNGDVF